MSAVTETVDDAHTGAVWSLVALPDRSGFVSGSADKSVKFWEWVLSTDDGGAKRLSCENTRTLKLTEDVLCCRVSPDGRLLAVALLDCTMKVRRAALPTSRADESPEQYHWSPWSPAFRTADSIIKGGKLYLHGLRSSVPA